MSAWDFRIVSIGALASLLYLTPTAKADGPPQVVVDGHFDHTKDKHGKDKFALSGIDCLDDGSHLCLVVDDEMTAVQFATLTSDVLKVGQLVDLHLDDEIIGKRPHKVTGTDHLNCSGGKDDGELDGEAVTHVGTTFYVVGSHGCSRNKAEYKPQTFVLSEIVVKDGKPGTPRNTYQLSKAILANDILRPHFGTDLKGAGGGASIEGMTSGADGKSLIIAFRSPSLNQKAFLMAVKIDPLFQENADFSPSDVSVHPVELGQDTGFRDIERLKDGRFLALTGAATEADAPFVLRMLKADFSLDDAAAKVQPPEGGSPEAIELLGDGRVLILSDDKQDGAPLTVSFP